jgi:hypothetical protein
MPLERAVEVALGAISWWQSDGDPNEDVGDLDAAAATLCEFQKWIPFWKWAIEWAEWYDRNYPTQENMSNEEFEMLEAYRAAKGQVTPELKPCPFCGKHIEEPGHDDWCPLYACGMAFSVDNWNRCTPDPTEDIQAAKEVTGRMMVEWGAMRDRMTEALARLKALEEEVQSNAWADEIAAIRKKLGSKNPDGPQRLANHSLPALGARLVLPVRQKRVRRSVSVPLSLGTWWHALLSSYFHELQAINPNAISVAAIEGARLRVEATIHLEHRDFSRAQDFADQSDRLLEAFSPTSVSASP